MFITAFHEIQTFGFGIISLLIPLFTLDD